MNKRKVLTRFLPLSTFNIEGPVLSGRKEWVLDNLQHTFVMSSAGLPVLSAGAQNNAVFAKAQCPLGQSLSLIAQALEICIAWCENSVDSVMVPELS